MGDPMAEESKEAGNKCMKEEKFIEAMFHYTKAIKIDPDPPTYYSNRSLAFLKMDQYYYALEDANTVIRKMPSWAKGYFRKAEVLMKAEDYESAIEAYKDGLKINEREEKLLAGLEQARIKFREQRKSENRMPWYGLAIGAFFGGILVILDVTTDKPILGNEIFQLMVLVLPAAVLYGLGYVYTYFIVSQRKTLLEPPMELSAEDADAMGMGDMGLKNTAPRPAPATKPAPTTNAKDSKGKARQRRKPNK